MKNTPKAHNGGEEARYKLRESPYVGNSTPIIRRLFGIDTSNDRPPSLVTIIRLMDGPLIRAPLESASMAEVAQNALPQWAIGKGGSDSGAMRNHQWDCQCSRSASIHAG